MSKSAPKDIWSIIKESKQNEKNTHRLESNLICLSQQKAGCTSVIKRILKEEYMGGNEESTVALEYRYKRYDENNFKQCIQHIWELAGSTEMLDLLDEIITPENIHSFGVVIVLDLMQSENLLKDLLIFLDKVDQICEKRYDFMRSKGSSFPEKMIQRHKKRFGVDHNDIDQVKFNGLPLIIVGTKFDQFQKRDVACTKLMAQTLRYIAHSRGASLIFLGNFSESSLRSKYDEDFRSMVKNIAMGTVIRDKKPVVDPAFPIKVINGFDTFKTIGNPPLTSKNSVPKLNPTASAMINQHPELEKWYFPYFSLFNQPTNEQQQFQINFEKYAEPAIDAMRKQKDNELLQYRRELKQAAQRKAMSRQKKS